MKFIKRSLAFAIFVFFLLVAPAFAQTTPPVDLKANNSDGPITVTTNSSVQLSWVLNNVIACTLSGTNLPSTTISANGQQTVTVSQNSSYSLSCTSNATKTTVSDSVTVNAVVPTPTTAPTAVPTAKPTNPPAPTAVPTTVPTPTPTPGSGNSTTGPVEWVTYKLFFRNPLAQSGSILDFFFLRGNGGTDPLNVVARIKTYITDTNPCNTIFKKLTPCPYTASNPIRSIVDIYGTGIFGKDQSTTTPNTWGSWTNGRNPGIKILPEGSVVMGGASSNQTDVKPASVAVPAELPVGFENLTNSDKNSGVYDFLLSMPTSDDYKARSSLYVRNLVVGDVADPVDLVIRRASSSTDPATANSSSYGKIFPLTPLPQAVGVLKWEGFTKFGWNRVAGITGQLDAVTDDGHTPGTLYFVTSGNVSEPNDQFARMAISSGKVIIGNSVRNITPTAQLDVRGDIKTTGCTGCADIAENYKSDEALEAGDIVAISSKEGYITKSTKSYDKKMIGIISSTPAIRISEDGGITLSKGDGSKSSDGYPVALTGRVPLKVSAENGPIEVGDYLTSSSVPGVAMKAVKPGKVIGQALEAYSGSDTHKIKVFVTNTYYIGD